MNATLLILFGAVLFAYIMIIGIPDAKTEIARLSKYNLDNQPYLHYVENHYVKIEGKTVASLKSKSKTDYAFLWSGSDTTTTAYIDNQEYLEVVTITPKKVHNSDMLTLFVVYKNQNKVILKSEDGKIGMSVEEYKQLQKSQTK